MLIIFSILFVVCGILNGEVSSGQGGRESVIEVHELFINLSD